MSSTPDPGLDERLVRVLDRIRSAELRHGRTGGSVGLLAVSKTQPAAAVRALAALSQTAFGENYLQEALDKRSDLADPALANYRHHLARARDAAPHSLPGPTRTPRSSGMFTSLCAANCFVIVEQDVPAGASVTIELFNEIVS